MQYKSHWKDSAQPSPVLGGEASLFRSNAARVWILGISFSSLSRIDLES